jgi:hypothetical protein
MYTVGTVVRYNRTLRLVCKAGERGRRRSRQFDLTDKQEKFKKLVEE